MKDTLKPGLTHRIALTVGDRHTVPGLYPESPMFQAMPKVFATGYMVGLFEWCCTELLNKHLDAGRGQPRRACQFQSSRRNTAGLDRHGRLRMHRGRRQDASSSRCAAMTASI